MKKNVYAHESDFNVLPENYLKENELKITEFILEYLSIISVPNNYNEWYPAWWEGGTMLGRDQQQSTLYL